MSDPRNTPSDQPDREGIKAKQRELARRERKIYAQILRDAPKLKFSNRDRLRAALYLGRLYRKTVNKVGDRKVILPGIKEKLEARCDHVTADRFRLDKWILRDSIEVVDEALVSEYKEKKKGEPLKKVAVYLAAVEALVILIGDDPPASEVDLLRGTDLWRQYVGNPTAPLADVEPALKLADLLHACARQVARKGDLASLFQKAQLLQVGWNLDHGYLADGPPFNQMEKIDMERPAGQQLVWSWEIPPYPNVLIARIPYAVLDSTLLMEERGRSAPLGIAEGYAASFKSVEKTGRLIAYRDLYLAVANVNAHEIGAVFFENYRVDVQINTLGPDFQKYHTSAAEMGNFHWFGRSVPEIECDGWRRIMLPQDAAINSDRICVEPGSKSDPLHDELPEDGTYCLVFAPVDASHVEDWLRRDKSLRGRDGDLLASVDSSFAKHAQDQVSTWNRDTASVARHVEAAIHSGAIEAELIAWTNRFRALMEAREQEWRVAAAEDEKKLRDRWHDEQMEGYGE